jgi:type II secretory pathway component PulF
MGGKQMRKTAATLHFSELLLVLLKGKTSLVDALQILARDGVEKQVKETASSLLSLMKKGKRFSESLSSINKKTAVFDPLYINLIAASELTGNVETVLERIARDLRRKIKAREDITNIMIYPSIIVLLAIAGTILIIVKGIPFFISGGLLSGNIVSDAIRGVCTAGAVLLVGGGALFFIYFKIFYNDSPEFRIFYMLDFLLRSNVTLIEAISHCILSLGQTKFGGALVSIKKDIAGGVPFSEAFSKIKYFSPYVLGWLSVADKQGNINDICASIKDYYENTDRRKRETAAKLMEPAVIVLTGAYVLIIMVTVILPVLTFAGGSLWY